MLLLQINNPHTRFSALSAKNPRAAKKIMKNINKIIRMASVGAALAVVFTIAFAAPAFAHASSYYGSYGGGSYNGGNYNNHNYNSGREYRQARRQGSVQVRIDASSDDNHRENR